MSRGRRAGQLAQPPSNIGIRSRRGSIGTERRVPGQRSGEGLRPAWPRCAPCRGAGGWRAPGSDPAARSVPTYTVVNGARAESPVCGCLGSWRCPHREGCGRASRVGGRACGCECPAGWRVRGCPAGPCGPRRVGWAKPSGRRLKTDSQTSTPVIDLVQKIPCLLGQRGSFLMRDHSLSPGERGALVEVGGTPILISPDSLM